jgi:chromosome segregation ATPase
LDDLRKDTLDKEADLRLKVNELSTKLAEKDRALEEMSVQKKTLKMHKKVLKDEVLRLRKELNEAEMKAQNKTVALKSLADFFNNQTLAKVRQMNPDLLA